MRRSLLLVAVLAFVAMPAFGQARKEPPRRTAQEERREAMKEKWPTAREVQAAINSIREWNKDRVARTRFRATDVEFWPVDIGRKSREERERGIVIGKLVSNVESKNGLPPGQYYVFTRKEGARWEVYFYTRNEVFEKSKGVAQNMEELKNPLFKDGGASVHYWVLKFDW